MSVEVEEESDPKRRCARLFWRLFPHVFLILSLILYAVLGAQIFRQIESKNTHNGSELEIRAVARNVVETVQNHTDASTQEALLIKIGNILTEFRNETEKYQNWSFYSSLFFSCTVFTTVGYGRMYPVTYEGKVACIVYAMVGIPLMLLVISDVCDILAVILSKAYTHLSLFFRQWMLHRSCIHRLENASPPKQVQGADTDDTYMFSQDIVVHETKNIQQMIKTQSSLRHTSLQIRNNKEIFDRMIIKENFKLKGTLTKSCSCPDLDRIPRSKTSSKLFIGIGQEMDRFKVPLLVILLVVFAYMVVCSQILKYWEKQMGHFDAFYFTFITLTTIGFGDILPEHPKYFMVTFLFIIMGMAIMSMAFKLGQSRIVSFYRRCIQCVSMGKVGIYEDLDSN
ncbi:potassium channel subfamily K member 18-like [Sinocyclocheilus rhinocerous]|uniref:potassium channel subfamily K member 18-like n=1 Tax=Sinocyclocheilus rhinocerous TaxID=307959 RepID=UPI0007BA43EC|nr:PREDICTED: potassium channel subfamily K member 18-like [Sinocyclocheilus rhinocerous]